MSESTREPFEALRALANQWRTDSDCMGPSDCADQLEQALAASAEPPKYRFAGNLKPQPYDAEPASTPAPELPLKHEFEAAPECYMCGKSWWKHQPNGQQPTGTTVAAQPASQSVVEEGDEDKVTITLLEARVAELEAALARIAPAKEKQ